MGRIESTAENPYWIEARLVKSKTGRKLVVYAGEKGRRDKAQIFVDPEIGRMSFDQNDRHPADIFARVEATFRGGMKSTIDSGESG